MFHRKCNTHDQVSQKDQFMTILIIVRGGIRISIHTREDYLHPLLIHNKRKLRLLSKITDKAVQLITFIRKKNSFHILRLI